MLICGLLVDAVWDVRRMACGRGTGARGPSRMVPGLTISNGMGLVPVDLSLAMAAFVAAAAHVLGNTTKSWPASENYCVRIIGSGH